MIDWKYLRHEAAELLKFAGWLILFVCAIVGALHILKWLGV